MKKRKNYFIEKKFQANFFVKFGLLLLVEALLIAALFMFISKDTLTVGYYGTDLKLQKTAAFFYINFLLISLIAGGSTGIAAMLIFMYFSHKIAGPLHRFEETIKNAQHGNFAQRVNIRKTDQLQVLRDPMNAFLKEMDGRIGEIKSDVQEGIDSINMDKAAGTTDKAIKALKKIKSLLEYFKTSK